MKRVVPDIYKEGPNVAERGRLLVEEEYMIPDQILKTDPFFERLRPKT